MREKLNILFDLTKIRITIFVTITMLFGFISAAGELNASAILPTIGILLLACGSAVINHYQEFRTDALMNRTKNRPIPAGRISRSDALKIALILLLSGSVMLFVGSGFIALALGLLNLIWYNGIYTPLKEKESPGNYSRFFSWSNSSCCRLGCRRWKHPGSSDIDYLLILFYLADSSFLVAASCIR